MLLIVKVDVEVTKDYQTASKRITVIEKIMKLIDKH
jgi:hypothetical protein